MLIRNEFHGSKPLAAMWQHQNRRGVSDDLANMVREIWTNLPADTIRIPVGHQLYLLEAVVIILLDQIWLFNRPWKSKFTIFCYLILNTE
jgi:hypothetical protein